MDRSTSFLRRVLLADAGASAATGLLMAAGAGPLEGLLGLPKALLLGAGLSLLPFAVVVAWLALRERIWRGGVWAVVALNILWVADSLLLLASGWVAPAALGYAFVLAQAAAVAVLAELEFIGLRRLAPAGQAAAA